MQETRLEVDHIVAKRISIQSQSNSDAKVAISAFNDTVGIWVGNGKDFVSINFSKGKPYISIYEGEPGIGPQLTLLVDDGAPSVQYRVDYSKYVTIPIQSIAVAAETMQ